MKVLRTRYTRHPGGIGSTQIFVQVSRTSSVMSLRRIARAPLAIGSTGLFDAWPASVSRSGPEDFLEEGGHRLPRALIGELVVSKPRHPRARRIRIGEAVNRTAITDYLPVSLALGHLFGEGIDLRDGHKRIVGTGTHQELGLDSARRRG